MRVITLNLNGIRAAERKGFFPWLSRQKADVVCLQEVRAHTDITNHELFQPQGYYTYYADAKRKGYSGVAIYTKQQPDKVVTSMGWKPASEEGRYLELDFPHMNIVSLYLPSGSSGEARQQFKFEFLARYQRRLKKQVGAAKPYIICGDVNIVHKEIDIKNWKSNQKNSGCLPEERAWLDTIFDKQGWVDAFRAVNQQPHQYTWWSNRGRAWDNNVGWRIDYQIVSPSLRKKIKSAKIYKAKRFSDHAPLIMDYDFVL